MSLLGNYLTLRSLTAQNDWISGIQTLSEKYTVAGLYLMFGQSK